MEPRRAGCERSDVSRRGNETRGARFRSEINVGPGGKQIQLLDPDNNPIELLEPKQ